MTKKLAIITSWWWMKCSWQVGALLCLAERFHITSPDILISASGSSGTWSYYVAKQYDSMRNIWSHLLSVKKMVNPRRFWKLIDIDYLIDSVFGKQDRLFLDRIYQSSTKYLIPALCADTGKVVYFSNTERADICQAMRASMAMPIAFKMNPRVEVDGMSCCDSMLTTNPMTHIAKAVEMWAKKILVIDVLAPKRRGVQYFLFALWVLFHGKRFKKNYFDLVQKYQEYHVPKWVEVFVLKSKYIPIRSTLDNDATRLKKAIQNWYSQTLNDKDLSSFLAS